MNKFVRKVLLAFMANVVLFNNSVYFAMDYSSIGAFDFENDESYEAYDGIPSNSKPIGTFTNGYKGCQLLTTKTYHGGKIFSAIIDNLKMASNNNLIQDSIAKFCEKFGDNESHFIFLFNLAEYMNYAAVRSDRFSLIDVGISNCINMLKNAEVGSIDIKFLLITDNGDNDKKNNEPLALFSENQIPNCYFYEFVKIKKIVLPAVLTFSKNTKGHVRLSNFEFSLAEYTVNIKILGGNKARICIKSSEGVLSEFSMFDEE